MLRRDSVSILQETIKDFWDSDIKVRKSKQNNESFSIVWRIINFTMCKLQKGEYFESPIFVIECLQNSNWYMRLYPRGHMDCDDIMCYLFRGNSSPDNITVHYKLSIGISDKYFGKVQTFEKYSQSAIPACAKRCEVFNEVQKYPLVDILLIDCYISNYETEHEKSISGVESMLSYVHKNECNSSQFPPELLHSTMDAIENLKRKIRPYPESCSIYTRIPVERWYFLWSIKRFSERQPNEKETITIVSVSESAPKILLTFFVNDEDNLEMHIRELTGKYGTFTVNFGVYLVGIHERNVKIHQDMHMFNSGEILKILLNVSRTKILLQENRFLMDDELTFRCELAISHENEVTNIDSCSYISDNFQTIPCNNATSLSKYPKLTWPYVRFFGVICVILFCISFAFDALI